jgi:hypothetical protein
VTTRKLRTLRIDEESGLTDHRTAIASRLQAHPEAMRMLIINPVLAFQEAGVELSPAVAKHLLHTIQYPPEIRAERTTLEDQLTAALGASPQPTDSAWLARTVFGQLGVAPVDIGSAEPTYRSSFDAADLAALQSMLPTRGVVSGPAPGPPRDPDAFPARMPFEPKSLGLLDLDAPVPDLPPAASAPTELSLTDLWFYKDAAPPLRPLLRLGVIKSSGVAIHSSTEYRKIRDGKSANALLSWITAVHIPSRSK